VTTTLVAITYDYVFGAATWSSLVTKAGARIRSP